MVHMVLAAASETPPDHGPRRAPLPPAHDGVLSRPALVAEVARFGGPRLVEAMLVPAVLFYVALVVFGVFAAYVAALAWSYSLVAARALTRRPLSAVHVLVNVGLTVKTVLAVVSGSTFVYFIQPVLGSAALAVLFFGSIVVGRPIIRWLATDFCPVGAEAASRHGVDRLWRRLTWLWGAVIVLKGATTLVFLLTLSLSTFVLVKTLALWGLTFAAVVATFALAFRTATHEQLVPVAVAGGDQRFMVTTALAAHRGSR